MTPKRRRLRLALVDLDDRIQKLQRLLARPLETVAADDGTGAAAVADLLDFLDQALRSLGGAAGEYDESAPVEGGLHHVADARSEEHTSELQSLMRISYAVFCLKKKKQKKNKQ